MAPWSVDSVARQGAPAASVALPGRSWRMSRTSAVLLVSTAPAGSATQRC